MNQKTLRWQQRFENLNKAFSQPERNLAIKTPNDTEKQGIIQSFEFTLELAWKTLKDYLESEMVSATTPREVIKQAFHNDILEDGDAWIDMLDKRNLMAHTYDEARANEALQLIREHYFQAIKNLITFFLRHLQSNDL